ERQLLATPRVARGDHAILVAPEDERRDLAQLRQWTVDPDPKLLAARQECSRLAPAPRLIGPDDRARRECARTRARAMTHELYDVRVRCFERRRQGESGEVDDVDGPAQPAESSDLWREPAPVGGDSRKNHGMGSCAAAPGGGPPDGEGSPGRHAEAVSLARGHLHPHA